VSNFGSGGAQDGRLLVRDLVAEVGGEDHLGELRHGGGEVLRFGAGEGARDPQLAELMGDRPYR
jgi:hypothetical protein